MGPRPIGRGNEYKLVAKKAKKDASMGPRPIGLGNVTAVTGGRMRTLSFNGATSNRTWKRGA